MTRIPSGQESPAQAFGRHLTEALRPSRQVAARPADTVLPGDGLPEPASEFLRCSTWLYLEPWTKAGRRRIYLHAPNGEQFGWKNLRDGTIAVTSDRNARLTRAVLTAASWSGLALAKEQLPKLPVKLPGGSFVSALTRTYMTVHIGQHWRKGSVDRLYCTAANPVHGVHALGYVDLVTGDLHPSDATLPAGWAPAEHLLRWILERRPTGG